MPGERFVVGLQPHPEMLSETDALHLKIFKALVEAAKKRPQRK